MIHDFVAKVNDPKNLDIKKCKEWWDKQQENDYFHKNEKTKTEKHFHFSRPELIKRLNLSKSSFILELGCGFGRETLKFCEISDNVWGLDISQTAADLTKENCPKANTLSYGGAKIPLADNTFDLVYSCFVIQHMSKQSARDLMKEAKRVLKTGGGILFEFLGGNYCAGLGKEHYSGGFNGMYNNGYLKEEIKQLVNETGMELVFMEEYKVLSDGTTNIWMCCKKND